MVFCLLISLLYQGAWGLRVIILVRRGACSSKIEDKTASYWSQSSVISDKGDLTKVDEFISCRSLCKLTLHSFRDFRTCFGLGGLETAKLQWTAKWSEIAGSSIEKFDVVVSSNLVIIRSKTLSLLWVGILTFMVFRLKQFNRSKNWQAGPFDRSLTWKLKSPARRSLPEEDTKSSSR